MYMPPAARFGYLVVIINIGTRVFPLPFLLPFPSEPRSNEKRRLGTERGVLISQDEIGLFDEILLCCCCGLHYAVWFLDCETNRLQCAARNDHTYLSWVACIMYVRTWFQCTSVCVMYIRTPHNNNAWYCSRASSIDEMLYLFHCGSLPWSWCRRRHDSDDCRHHCFDKISFYCNGKCRPEIGAVRLLCSGERHMARAAAKKASKIYL